MTDIRLNQPKSTQIWTTVSVLAVVALILWGAATIFGDRTAAEERPGVGATAGFGDHRAPVLPAQAAPFGSVSPPGPRDLGRLVQLVGRGESRVRVHSLWVRTPENYRILVRFDPEPPPELLAGIGPGSAVSFHGYVTAI
ncbi:MAG: hypothetical protein LBG44_01540, partial [Gemmatimonadota bacterium]|nr:hypothetical protein [Gemmatimonadota bacterium]